MPSGTSWTCMSKAVHEQAVSAACISQAVDEQAVAEAESSISFQSKINFLKLQQL